MEKSIKFIKACKEILKTDLGTAMGIWHFAQFRMSQNEQAINALFNDAKEMYAEDSPPLKTKAGKPL